MSQRLRRERAAIPQKSRWRVVGYVVAGVLGAAIVLGATGLLLILHTTPPPMIRTDPAAATRLLRELKEAQAAAVGGTPRVVQADETEINSTVEQYLRAAIGQPSPAGSSSVQDMKLNFSGDRMRMYVLLNVRGKDLTVELEGKLRTLDGYLDFEPLNGRIGALPVPKSSLKRAFQQMTANPESRTLLQLPKELRDVHVEDGKIVVVYR